MTTATAIQHCGMTAATTVQHCGMAAATTMQHCGMAAATKMPVKEDEWKIFLALKRRWQRTRGWVKTVRAYGLKEWNKRKKKKVKKSHREKNERFETHDA